MKSPFYLSLFAALAVCFLSGCGTKYEHPFQDPILYGGTSADKGLKKVDIMVEL